jgi:hypothetical protein
MRRLAAVLFAAALVLLMLQTPAAAKGPNYATIVGPGIGTLKLTWEGHEQSFNDLVETTRFWDGAGVAAWHVDRPAGDLGPRFALTYHVPDHHRPSSGKATLIRQELYPYASGGPVVYMPEGQTMYGVDMPYGWLATDQRLTEVVDRLGGTSREPSAERAVEPAAHETAANPDGGSDGGSGWGVVAWGVAGAVLLTTAVGWRLRVHRRA